MSSADMIFSRDTMELSIRFGGENVSRMIPSFRNRTRTLFSNGSMWMSLAPSLTAL